MSNPSSLQHYWDQYIIDGGYQVEGGTLTFEVFGTVYRELQRMLGGAIPSTMQFENAVCFRERQGRQTVTTAKDTSDPAGTDAAGRENEHQSLDSTIETTKLPQGEELMKYLTGIISHGKGARLFLQMPEPETQVNTICLLVDPDREQLVWNLNGVRLYLTPELHVAKTEEGKSCDEKSPFHLFSFHLLSPPSLIPPSLLPPISSPCHLLTLPSPLPPVPSLPSHSSFFHPFSLPSRSLTTSHLKSLESTVAMIRADGGRDVQQGQRRKRGTGNHPATAEGSIHA